MNVESPAAPPQVQLNTSASTTTRPVRPAVERERQLRARSGGRAVKPLSWRDRLLYGATVTALFLVATLCAVLTGYQLGVGHESQSREPLKQELVDATTKVKELRRQLEAQALDLQLKRQQVNSHTLTVSYLREAHLKLQGTLAEQRDELALYRSIAKPADAAMPALALRDPVIVGDARDGFDIELTLVQPGGTETLDVLAIATLWMQPQSVYGDVAMTSAGSGLEAAPGNGLLSSDSTPSMHKVSTPAPVLPETLQSESMSLAATDSTREILLSWVADLSLRPAGLSTGSVLVSVSQVPIPTPEMLARDRSTAALPVALTSSQIQVAPEAIEPVLLPAKAVEFAHTEHRVRFFKRIAMGLELPERLRRGWLPDRISLAIYPADADPGAVAPLLTQELEWTSHYRPARSD